MAEKTCNQCHETKPISHFHKGTRMKDGRLNQCRDCRKKRNQVYRRAGVGLKSHRQNANNYSKKHREKRKVRMKTFKAIKRGTLIKQPCKRCSEENSHAHHEDYRQFLNVIWLCALCHVQRHKEISAEIANGNAEFWAERGIEK